MFKELLKNRLLMGALGVFVVFVGGCLLYLQHLDRQLAAEKAHTAENIQQWEARQQAAKPVEPPAVEQPQQGGHTHADGTWHAEPHEAHVEPPSEAGEPVRSEKTEKTVSYDGDPDLKSVSPDGKLIMNFDRPLTAEEQAEYDRLKATEKPEAYGGSEAQLKGWAIVNIQQKNRPAVARRIWDDMAAGLISKEEAIQQLREFSGITPR